jgi:eukaryotic-like serine/threonine-protein kinase
MSWLPRLSFVPYASESGAITPLVRLRAYGKTLLLKFVEGGSLGRHLEGFRNDPPATARLLQKVARAVHCAHQRGILQRDLKPSNILLDTNGEPIVTDFGLAKRLESASVITHSGAIVGTPGYLAPEQSRAEKSLSTAVDVYSLGAILYELLTGRPPFQGSTPMETVRHVLEHEPASLRASAQPTLGAAGLAGNGSVPRGCL